MTWTFVHQEYPRCLHGPGDTTLIVHNDEDRDRELAAGWSMRPVVDAPVSEDRPELTNAPLAAVVAEVVAEVHQKRGRPRKTDA